MIPKLGPLALARLLRIVALGYAIWSSPKSAKDDGLLERAEVFLGWIRGAK